MICAWPMKNVISTSITLIVARIPKITMNLQNAGASSSCIAVNRSVALVGQDNIQPHGSHGQQQH